MPGLSKGLAMPIEHPEEISAIRLNHEQLLGFYLKSLKIFISTCNFV
jgi:hypothetical protein